MKRAGKTTRLDSARPRLRPFAAGCLRILAIFTIAGFWSSFAATRPALAQPPEAVHPGYHRAERAAHAVRVDPRDAAARPESRLLLPHPLRGQRPGQAPELGLHAGSLRPGLEDARHEERLSLLLRRARPEHRSIPRAGRGSVPRGSSRVSPIRSAPSASITRIGTYVPIYDLDPIAPGPGPYPYPVLLQLAARRLSRVAASSSRSRRSRPTHNESGPSHRVTARPIGHARQRISGDRFSAASVMNACIRATRSSGSGVTPSRIIASLQSCNPHCLMNSWC